MKKHLLFMVMMLLGFTAQAAETPVALPEGVEAQEYTLAITHRVYQADNQYTESSKEVTAYVAFDGNDVYVSGLSYYFPAAYVKGTYSDVDERVTFESGQYLGSDQYGNEYLTSYVIEDGKGVITPFVFLYDPNTKSLTFDGFCHISETTERNGGGFYADVVMATYTPGGVPPLVPVEVPADLTTEDYLFIGTMMINEQDADGALNLVEEPYERPVKIGFYGDDVYMQGLIENVPEGWARATKNSSGKYVIPSGQYLGSVQAFNLVFDYFISGVGRNNQFMDITFTYNDATKSFSCSQTIAATNSDKKPESYFWIKNVQLKKITEREATPATPQFTFTREPAPYGSTTWYYATIFVPMTDTEGEPMLGDKLSFTFYNKKNGTTAPVTFHKDKYYMLQQDMTEIPFGFTDGLEIGLHDIFFEKMGEDELKSWEALGLQSIYRGNGVEHRSDIFWFDMAAFWQSLGITVSQSDKTDSNAIYNLSGQRLQSPRKGLNIIGGRKVLVK